MTHWKFLPQR